MLNHFLLHPTELRHAWKELRKTLTTDLPDVQHYQTVINWWSSAPIGKRYLDYTSCEDWQDPWEIIDSKEFDTDSVALCMFYTLLFVENSPWTSDRLSLVVIMDRKHSTEQLVCVVDGKWLLGYNHATLTNFDIESDLECRQTYNYNSRLRQIEESTTWKSNKPISQPASM